MTGIRTMAIKVRGAVLATVCAHFLPGLYLPPSSPGVTDTPGGYRLLGSLPSEGWSCVTSPNWARPKMGLCV